MASTTRSLRLLKAMEAYAKARSSSFENLTIFNKMKLSLDADGSIKGAFTVDSTMCNGGGTLHGGYMASVIDVISLVAQLNNPDGKIAWTTSLHVNFLKTSLIGDKVTVDTKVLKSGNTSVVEAYLQDDTGSILAKGTASFMAGGEKYQQLFKNALKFDAHEENK